MACVFGFKYHFVVFFGSEVVEIIVDRILRLPAESHFIVKVGAGRFAGVADFADEVTSFDFLPGLDEYLGKVSIAGGVVIAVGNLDQIAILAFP